VKEHFRSGKLWKVTHFSLSIPSLSTTVFPVPTVDDYSVHIPNVDFTEMTFPHGRGTTLCHESDSETSLILVE
jgi:hypothetical protein